MHLAFSRPQPIAAAATDAGVACTGSSRDGAADRRAPNAADPGATQADLATRQAQDA